MRLSLRGVTLVVIGTLTGCGGGGDGGTAPPPSVTAVAVSPTSVPLQGVGATASVTATLAPSNASGTITWRTNDASVATVSGSGAGATITAVGAGTTTVTASVGSLSGSVTVTVTPIVRAITVLPTTAAVIVGGSTRITPTLTADPGASSALQWTSSATAIATVDATGNVTGVAAGSATITVASVASPAVTASVAVVVSFPVVNGVTITPAAPTVLSGLTRQMTATVDAASSVSTAVTWTSSTTNVATVNATGLVTAVTAGTTTIRATSVANPTVSGTTVVTVSAPTVRAVSLSPATANVAPGATRQLTATLDADAGASTALTWTTSDAAIALVSNSGLVTAVAPGTATIRATSVANPGVSGTAVITIAAPTVRSIALAPASASIATSATRQLMATIDADAGANTALTWSSSDVNVAQVSATGLVTAVSPGAATVRATSVLVPTVFASSIISVTAPLPLSNWAAQPSSPAATVVDTYVFDSYSLSNGSGWAVATLFNNDLRFLKFDGSQWITTNEAPFQRLLSIGGFGDNAWVGSADGRIARLAVGNGTQTWIPQTQINQPVRRIIGLSETSAAALANRQLLLQVAGTWSVMPYNGVGDIADIAGTAIDNLMMVLYEPSNGTRVHRWNGSAWTTVTDAPIGGQLLSAAYRGGSLIVANNLGQSALYDGASWSTLSVPASRAGTVTERIGSIVTCNGQAYASTQIGGRVFRLSGSSWTTIADYGVALAGSSNTEINCGADNVLRATGANGAIGRYTGSSWVWEVSGHPIERIVMVRPDLAWASGGYGSIRKWDGTRWTTDFSDATAGSIPIEGMLRGLTAASDGTVMATRGIDTLQSGAIYRRQASGNWVTDNTAGHCEDVWAHSSTFALAVGEGCGLRWNGSSWSNVSGLPATPHSISGSGPTNAIAVGQNGAASASSRWDGTTWTALSTPSVGALHAVRVASATVAFALGASGVLRWDGVQWSTMNLPAELSGVLPLRDLSANGPSDVYVLTRTAALWHYNGTSWSQETVVSGAQGDALLVGPRSLATLPGYGMIGTGFGAILHASTVSAVRSGIAIPGRRMAPSPGSVDAREVKDARASGGGGPPRR